MSAAYSRDYERRGPSSYDDPRDSSRRNARYSPRYSPFQGGQESPYRGGGYHREHSISPRRSYYRSPPRRSTRAHSHSRSITPYYNRDNHWLAQITLITHKDRVFFCLVLFSNGGYNFELQLSYSLAFLKNSQVYTSISGLVTCFVSYVLCYFWCSLLGADDVNRESWQLITAIHDEGDGLILCKVTLTRLWPHSFLSCQYWFCWNWQNAWLPSKFCCGVFCTISCFLCLVEFHWTTFVSFSHFIFPLLWIVIILEPWFATSLFWFKV